MTRNTMSISGTTAGSREGGGCDERPCQGGGTCEEHDGTFTCFCTKDRTGDRCQTHIAEGDVAAFSGTDSFVKLRPLKHADKHKLSLEMEVRPASVDHGGILFYAHQNPNGDGDFLAVTVRDGGKVQFR